MIRLSWYKDPDHPNIVADRTYRDVHRKSARIKKCLEIVNGWTHCSSILDVGCKSLGFLEMVGDQYTERLQIDYCRPSIPSSTVPFKQMNLLDLFSDRDTCLPIYDVVVCLEVMEHVEPCKRRSFAANLFTVCGKYLVVSIPYNWSGTGWRELHPHDGYNESNLLEWFYPWWPDWTHKEGKHLIACFDKMNLREGTLYE